MAKKTLVKVTEDKPFASVNNVLDKIYSLKNLRSTKKVYIIVLITGLLLLAIYKKSWFIAATVNGTPLTNLELQAKLNQQFRTQTLNQLIDQKIIIDEARKNNAIPTETEIDQKIKDLETQYGGPQTFDSLLSQQGLTRLSIRDQIKIPLIIAKLYDQEATVSAEEVDKFVEQNKESLQATESAKQKEEAFNLLKQQKISQLFNQKFQELRQKAKIVIF